MDVMRTAVSALGTVEPESDRHDAESARAIADRLMASLGSMLLYWHHWGRHSKRIDVETADDSIGGHFLHLLHGSPPPPLWIRAMDTSLNLYAEHEFNASTFTARVIAGTGSDLYSALTGAIGALRGPKHGGANEFSFEVQNRYSTPDEAEADIRRRLEMKQVIIAFVHPPTTPVLKTASSCRSASAFRQHVRRDFQRPPRTRSGNGRHRGLRDAIPDRKRGGVHDRALLPARHARLRLRGAVVSGVHE